ncbi:MAG: hypothetical protein LBP58_07020, partial [Azoarcus sp.]|nr:hypothetical protein [Azoarcus sp.]
AQPACRPIQYGYDLVGRLVGRGSADPDTVYTIYTYAADDRLIGLTYQYGLDNDPVVLAAPGVRFAWDPWFPRLAALTDGLGTTRYTLSRGGKPGDAPWRGHRTDGFSPWRGPDGLIGNRLPLSRRHRSGMSAPHGAPGACRALGGKDADRRR